MDHSNNQSTIGKTIGLVGKVCVGATTLAAVISDVLYPIAPFSAYIASFLVLLLFLISISVFIPFLNINFKRIFGVYWYWPITLTVTMSSIMLFGVYALGLNSNDSGYLSERFPLVASLQKDIGLIEQHTKAIAKSTHKIERNTNEISSKMDNVKNEISNDPRKEIANLGSKWSVESFVNALMEGDIRRINLFLEGGMKPTKLHKGSSAILYAF